MPPTPDDRRTCGRRQQPPSQAGRQAGSQRFHLFLLPPSRWGCPRASFTFYCLLNYLHKIFQSGISLLFLCHCGRKSRLECNSICALPRPLLVATLAAAAFLHIIVGVSLRGRQFQCSPCFSLFLFYTLHLTFPLSLPFSPCHSCLALELPCFFYLHVLDSHLGYVLIGPLRGVDNESTAQAPLHFADRFVANDKHTINAIFPLPLAPHSHTVVDE